MTKLYRDPECEERAREAASYIRNRIVQIPIACVSNTRPVVLILGSGWRDAIQLEYETVIPFADIPGLDGIPKKENHAHVLKYGLFNGVEVFVLSGRVHMNTMIMHPEARIPQKVRLQTEMLLQSPLNLRTFIVTNAAGGAKKGIDVGELIVADGFLSRYAILPLTEHVDPESALDPVMAKAALLAAHDTGLMARLGGYAMLMGPHFESREYDKKPLARSGVKALGMSTVQEASTIALYKEEGARMVAVSFISNNSEEEHSDAEIARRVSHASPKLEPFLAQLTAQCAQIAAKIPVSQ